MDIKLVVSRPIVCGNNVEFEADGRFYRTLVFLNHKGAVECYRIKQRIIRRFGYEWRNLPEGPRSEALKAAVLALTVKEKLPLHDGSGAGSLADLPVS